MMQCELVSWSSVQGRCEKLATLIRESGYQPDIVIAIGRGGYVPARLLCDYLHLSNLTSIKVEHYLSGARKQREALIRYPLKADIKNQKVLLVDDVNDTGDTFDVALRHLQEFAPAEIRTAVILSKKISSFNVDYETGKIIKWRWLIFPWAVYEDISEFLKQAPQGSLQQSQDYLQREYNIRIPLKRLANIYNSLL